MGGKRTTEINDQTVDLIHRLFTVIAPRFANRPGGYTRIIKRSHFRLGDGGATCYFEFLKEGEARRERERTAPAPKVEILAEQQQSQSTQSEQPAKQASASSSPAGEAETK